MKYWVDLHIHSCLSPCAANDMTPNNIVNMALLKGLDIIAITDHNSARNADALVEAGKRAGLLVVPGMELCTAEEIHLVCLMPDLDKVNILDEIVYQNLFYIKNREDIFGPQLIMDSGDNVLGKEKTLLAGACKLDIGTAIDIVRNLGGVVIPAHADRQAFSMLNTLGTIPKEYNFKYIEYSRYCKFDEFIGKHSGLSCYKWITSSDAHELGDILEKEVSIELENKSINTLLNKLKS